jgi:hypothetical protein
LTSTYAAGYKYNLPPSPVPISNCTPAAGKNLVTVLGITWTTPIAPLVFPWDMSTNCADISQSGEIFVNPVVTNSTLNTPAWCTSHCAASGYSAFYASGLVRSGPSLIIHPQNSPPLQAETSASARISSRRRRGRTTRKTAFTPSRARATPPSGAVATTNRIA